MYLAGKSEAISLVEICGQKIHPYICRVYVFVGMENSFSKSTAKLDRILIFLRLFSLWCRNGYYIDGHRKIHDWTTSPSLFGSDNLFSIIDYESCDIICWIADVCRPNYDVNQCSAYDYITNYTCTGKPARVQDARWVRLWSNQFKSEFFFYRESFPSGHSSFSFYTMMFTIVSKKLKKLFYGLMAACLLQLYMQARMNFLLLDTQLLRPLIQILLFCMAFACGLSRISDYKHHWSDVLAGGILGCLVAYALVSFWSDI